MYKTGPFIAFFCLCSYATVYAQNEPVKIAEEIIKVRNYGVSISGPTLLCEGSESYLKVDGEYESYEWNTGSRERIIRINKEGVYEVTVKTKGGCTYTSSVNVRVQPCS